MWLTSTLLLIISTLFYVLLTPYTPIPLGVEQFKLAKNIVKPADASLAALSPALRAWHSRGQYASVLDSFRMFFVDLGDPSALPKDTLVLIHGFPSSSFDWRLCVDSWLQRRFKRIVAMDLIGFGFSDKPQFFAYSIGEQADAVQQLLHIVNVSGSHVTAHDMGDTILTELLYRKHLGFTRFGYQSVTFTNGGMRLELSSLRLTQQLLRLRPVARIMPLVTTWWIFHRQIRSLNLVAPSKIPEFEIRAMWELLHYKQGINRVPIINDYLNQRYQFQHKWLSSLRELDCPVHILWGKNDAVAPKEIAKALKLHDIPQAIHSFVDLGHFLMLEDSLMFSEAVLWFYNGAGVQLFAEH